MLNFLVALFSFIFIRKQLKTEETLPKYDAYIKMLGFYGVPFLFIASQSSFEDKFEPTFSFAWFLVFSCILYILWLLKENSLANSLLKAGIPFFVVNSVKDFCSYFLPKLQEEYDNVFDIFYLGGVFWLIAFGVSTYNQLKALRKEEEKVKVVIGENEKLEILVKERTSEILLQKNQLETTIEELKVTQIQLIQQEKLASLGELTAGIAHEIQNPLNFVNNFSELNVELIDELAKETEKGKGKIDHELLTELLGDIKQNQEKINFHGKRASSIVKGMLQHSRMSTGQKEAIDINALADEFLKLSYHGIRAKDKSFNSDFRTDFELNLPMIDAVPQDIGRVFLNIINNAFYAVQQRSLTNQEEYKPMVIITTKELNGTIEIRIKDNGGGISEANKEKIFQPFFTTKPTGKGTGLGLSLAYDIVVKGHGGTIDVQSEEGKGTEFVIVIPINLKP